MAVASLEFGRKGAKVHNIIGGGGTTQFVNTIKPNSKFRYFETKVH